VKLKILILIFFCISLTQASGAFGQELADEPIPSDSSGEIHSSLSDMMRTKARESGERLFVIVRLGDGETSRRVATARIKAAKGYFLRDDNFKAQTAIFAEGERVKGEGRFEYYLGSKLQFVALAPKNKTINFTCCEDYFPPVKKKTKRKRSKR
jgi:hypothetical protein